MLCRSIRGVPAHLLWATQLGVEMKSEAAEDISAGLASQEAPSDALSEAGHERDARGRCGGGQRRLWEWMCAFACGRRMLRVPRSGAGE